MPDGPSAAGANAMLNALTADMAFAELHTGAPGSAGTSNLSSVTTRQSVTWPAASGGSVTASNVPTWAAWAGTNGEVDTDLAFWTLATGGVFGDSVQLGSSVTVYSGDTLELTSITVSIPTAS